MSHPRFLITGSSGQLGSYLIARLEGRPIIAWAGSRDVNLADAACMAEALDRARPDVIIHAAAMARVDDCFRDPAAARAINVDATRRLAEWADRHGARLVFVSTDLVFDGEHAPYCENDSTNSLSVYGRSKTEAELEVLAARNAAVARVCLMVGPNRCGRSNFWDHLVQSIQKQSPTRLFADEWRTPLSYASAADGLIRLAESSQTGVWHLGGSERLTRLEMGQRIAKQLGASGDCLIAAERNAGASEPRPRDVSLDSSRFRAAFPAWRTPPIESAWLD